MTSKLISEQWIIASNKAIIKAWEDKGFKKELLGATPQALKELGFHIPKNITIEFIEVADNEYRDFPEINLSLFDSVPSTPTQIKVTIPAKPETLSDLQEELASVNVVYGCCCVCA